MFVFTSYEFEPRHVRFSLFFSFQIFVFSSVFAFESRFFFFFACNFMLPFFVFMFGLLPFFLLYRYRVPAQSEHMLDPHNSFSPVADSSLAI